jgi:elongation factor 1-gamma
MHLKIETDSCCFVTSGAMAAPEGKLLSTDKTVAAQIAQWAAFADSEITAYHGAMSGMVAGYFAYAKPTYTSFAQKLESRLTVLNKYLEDKTYLVGDRVTFADVAVAGALFGAFTGKGHADAAVRAKVPNVVRFFET